MPNILYLNLSLNEFNDYDITDYVKILKENLILRYLDLQMPLNDINIDIKMFSSEINKLVNENRSTTLYVDFANNRFGRYEHLYVLFSSLTDDSDSDA